MRTSAPLHDYSQAGFKAERAPYWLILKSSVHVQDCCSLSFSEVFQDSLTECQLLSVFPSQLIVFSDITHNHLKNVEKWKRYFYAHVHSSIIHSSQKVNQLRCPSTDAWIKEMWYIHSMQHFLALKMGGNSDRCHDMEEP